MGAARGDDLDRCIVGEPTNASTLGDMIKIGRRGSISALDSRHRQAGPCRLSAARRKSERR